MIGQVKSMKNDVLICMLCTVAIDEITWMCMLITQINQMWTAGNMGHMGADIRYFIIIGIVLQWFLIIYTT